MPKELTHILFADAVAARLEAEGQGELGRRLARHRAVYHHGSVAPDTFAYQVLLPWFDRDYQPCGDRLHGSHGNDPTQPIIHLSERLRDAPGQPLAAEKFAFLCGYLTHMALDITFHPWVYNVTGNYFDADPAARRIACARHFLLEAWLDLYMLRRAGKDFGSFRPFEAISDNSRINRPMLTFLGEGLRRTWEIRPSVVKYLHRFYRVQLIFAAVIRNHAAARTAVRINHWRNGSLLFYVAAFYPPRDAPIPAGLFDFQGFRHPMTDAWHPSGLDGLWRSAEDLAMAALIAADAIRMGAPGEALDRILQRRSLDMGMPSASTRNARYFDCHPIDRLWPWKLPPD